ncbi:hypothetical protein EST92_24135 [Streptomyces sp. TM32]|uniref:hypothetical protein n=1 Tax=Streptomyces sp. TM32 TaxID=1652669 RepID=UPI001011BAD6|nr:hypothetical protein [Streptomyces sp. TM32]RXS70984.1 hypothetical protein EST92_24135 [Streptomyces sp. TM32]
MEYSGKRYLVPKVPDLARIVKVLGGTPTTYMPQGPKATELFSTACLATAAQARATKAAREAQRALAEAGADDELASLSKLTIVAMEEGDDRLDAVPQLRYWQISNIAVALRDLREQAPQADPLIEA